MTNSSDESDVVVGGDEGGGGGGGGGGVPGRESVTLGSVARQAGRSLAGSPILTSSQPTPATSHSQSKPS